MAGEAINVYEDILKTEHPLAVEIANNWTTWHGLQATHRERISEVKEFTYATSTKETSNDANDHNHSTNVPKITQIYDNLKANYKSGLMPNERWFKFKGYDIDSVTADKRDNIEAYLRTKHRDNGFRTVVDKLLDDWLLEGNCYGGVEYVNNKHILPSGEEVIGYSGPKPYRIAPSDIAFNIVAPDFESAPKIIRSVKSLGELAREIEDNPELNYQSEIFNKVTSIRNVSMQLKVEDIDKSSQITLDGFGTYGAYLKSGYIEILEFYGDIYDISNMTLYKNYVITVVDRKWVIRQQPLSTLTGRPHIYHAGWRARPDNLVAMGPLENLVGMQYKINHLENARADAFDQMLIPDRVLIGDVEETVNDDGSITYRVTSERGDVKNLAPDPTILNADFQIRETEEKMELFAGAPREAAGVRTPGEKTKFEVAELSNARGRLFQSKMVDFEIQMLEKLLNAEIELGRKYLSTTGDLIETEKAGRGIKTFINVSKKDLVATGKLQPIGARHFARTAQLAQNLMQFHNGPLQDPSLAVHFPAKRLAQLWEQLLEFDEFELMQEYGRIAEQMQAERLTMAATSQLQLEQQTPLEDEDGFNDEENEDQFTSQGF